MSKKTNQYDIAIIGSGIVGLLSALTLARKGFNVVLTDAYKISINSDEIDPLNVRSIALSLSSKQILQSFGFWQGLQPYCQPILDIQVSSQGHWGVTRLNHLQQQCDALGYVVESHHLTNALTRNIESVKNITLIDEASCEAFDNNDNGCHISLNKNNKTLKLEVKLGLICDGANSKTRDMAGFSSTSTDYQQMAIAAHVSGKHTQNSIAYERFTPEGPMAMLPLTDGRYGLVWTNSIDRSKQLMAMNEDEFLSALHQDFGFRLGRIEKIGTRITFPLHRIISKKLSHNRCVVLGNSAHNLHPVAGQSLNLAIRDIAHLNDFLTSFDDLEQTLGNYQALRQKDHDQVIQLGDTLITLFSNNVPILNHVRSAGLAFMDVLPTLKNDFAWRGMGFAQSAASAQRGTHE